MKKLLLAAAAALAIASQANAQVADGATIDRMEREAVGAIAQMCEKEWPSNYEMQVYCRRKQNDAARDFYKMARDIKTAEQDPETKKAVQVASDVANRCFREWKGNFEMTMYCIRKQLNAYKELQRQDSEHL
jgi:hypothetical protein